MFDIGAGKGTRTLDPNLGKIRALTKQVSDSKGKGGYFARVIRNYTHRNRINKLLRYFSKIALLFLIIACPLQAFAGKSGFLLFVGFGYDQGPYNYHAAAGTPGNIPYRDSNQGIYGIEYNNSFSGFDYRFQYLHSSGLHDAIESDHSDMNLFSFQITAKPENIFRTMFK